MIRNFFLGCLVLSVFYINGQKSVNDFKYVVVPEAFVFLNESDQYQLNSLAKFLFEKYGFTAFTRGTKLPEDLQKNGCLALLADVQKKPGLFLTKLVVQLKDCNGIVIFTSQEGGSREKEFKRAYQEALREAFTDIQGLQYNYKKNIEKETIASIASQENNEEGIKTPVLDRVQDNTQVAEPVGVSIVKEKAAGVASQISDFKDKLFTWNGKDFMFRQQDYGYELFEFNEEKKNNLGKIFASERENTFMVKAGDYSGNGYFDAYGNFVLERINPATNKLIKDIFARQ